LCDSYRDRPLPPLPLVPDHTTPVRHRTPENESLSNATLKALLWAEDASNASQKENEERFTKNNYRLSSRSEAIVRDFSQFAQQSFSPKAPKHREWQSDGTLWLSAPSQTRRRVARLADEKPRARSLQNRAMRMEKSKGGIFEVRNGEFQMVGE
jgi:hypothetical protein